MANLFRGFTARKKIWLRFMLANLEKKVTRLLRLLLVLVKLQNIGTTDIFKKCKTKNKVTDMYLER